MASREGELRLFGGPRTKLSVTLLYPKEWQEMGSQDVLA